MELVLIMQITRMEMDKAWKRADGGWGGGESHFKVMGIFLVSEKLEILVSLARVLLRVVHKEISTCKAHTSLL